MNTIFNLFKGPFVTLSCMLATISAHGMANGGRIVMVRGGVAQSELMLTVSDEQPTELEEKALEGSPTAALRIAKSILSRNYASDIGFYWLTIAVENGSKEAMCDLGAFLSIRKNDVDRIRAKYWLERAMKEGNTSDAKRAKAYLDDMINGFR